MKYPLITLAMFLIAGTGLAVNLTVYDDFYCRANTTYDWTLTKTADRTNLEFEPAPDPEAEPVVFTIAVTRSDPYNTCYIEGRVDIYNAGSDPATITSVVTSIYHHNVSTGDTTLLVASVIFSGSYTLNPGSTFAVPFHIDFTTTGDITNALEHYTLTSVYTDDGSRFQSPYRNYFHATPTVVNETLHVWDVFNVPSEFSYTWDYNGPWTESGSNSHTINVSITNQSATSGTYQAVDYVFGSNECGFWADTIYLEFHVTPPPDSEWNGYTFTPGYWKNHPEAFDQWLPVTIPTITVSTVQQAINILKTNNPAWPRFLKFYLAMKFNSLSDPSLLNAYYNDKSKTGEFMEGQTVVSIFSVADGYTSNTPTEILNAMKDVFDNICNNATTHVLWLIYNGGSGKTVPLPNSPFFTLTPNPFTNRTEIRFLTEVKEPITVSVYDISGAKVRDLIKNVNSNLYWDGTDNNGRKLTRGVYIIRANNLTSKALLDR